MEVWTWRIYHLMIQNWRLILLLDDLYCRLVVILLLHELCKLFFLLLICELRLIMEDSRLEVMFIDDLVLTIKELSFNLMLNILQFIKK